MTQVSFIIPAYNEQKFISQTLASIRQYTPDRYSWEVIVVDHGSTDQTAQLARDGGAIVCTEPQARTISELRNIGVRRSRADILVFLDADTTLTPGWTANFPETYDELARNPLLITGSIREAPPSASWISRNWFRTARSENEPTHLGGGHIITTRALFDRISGFSLDLETGEDYDFCVRARKAGARILSRPQLQAIHHGVPRYLKQFFLREIWHGRGDWLRLNSILDSKVAVASIAFTLLHMLLVVAVALPSTRYSLSVLAALGIAAICLYSAMLKYRGQPVRVILSNALLFYVYYCARSLSFFSVLLRRSSQKHVRGT